MFAIVGIFPELATSKMPIVNRLLFILSVSSHIIANIPVKVYRTNGKKSTTKNEILNSTSPTGSSVYFCTVDIYSFIHPWYGYLSF